jgi:hypothetical protein
MDGQLSFATLDYAGKKKRTKRDVFLAEMAAAVPWSVLEAVIAPHYPKEGPQGGRRAFPIAVMLRIYCLQQKKPPRRTALRPMPRPGNGKMDARWPPPLKGPRSKTGMAVPKEKLPSLRDGSDA